MRQTRWIVALGVGLVTATLSGDAVFSQLRDEVAIAGNSIVSPAQSASRGTVDIRVARTSRPKRTNTTVADCSGVPLTAYSDGPVKAVFVDQQVDVSAAIPEGRGAVQVARQPDLFCVRNFGTGRVTLGYAFLNVKSLEVGPCAAGERAAGDTTCPDDNTPPGRVTAVRGELERITGIGFDGSFDGPCRAAPSSAGLNRAGVLSLTDAVAPGEVCPLTMVLFRQKSTTQEQGQAVTDRVEFDVLFSAGETAS